MLQPKYLEVKETKRIPAMVLKCQPRRKYAHLRHKTRDGYFRHWTNDLTPMFQTNRFTTPQTQIIFRTDSDVYATALTGWYKSCFEMIDSNC